MFGSFVSILTSFFTVSFAKRDFERPDGNGYGEVEIIFIFIGVLARLNFGGCNLLD